MVLSGVYKTSRLRQSSNEDAGERIPASMNELVRRSVQGLVSDKYFGGKDVVQLTKQELKIGLHRLTEKDERQVGVQKFTSDMMRVLVLRMDSRKIAQHRVLAVKHALTDCD